METEKAIVAKSADVRFRCSWCVTMSKPAFGFRHIYPSALNLVVRRLSVGSQRQRFGGLLGEVMHDPESELRRIPLPRTSLNKAD